MFATAKSQSFVPQYQPAPIKSSSPGFSSVHPLKQHRLLEDLNPSFIELDEILKSSGVFISESEITDLPFPLPSSSKLILEEVSCDFLGLDEITDSFRNPTRFRSIYSLGLRGFDLSCTFNWEFIGGAFGEGQEIGSGVLSTEGNSLDIVFSLVRSLFTWNNEQNEANPPVGLNLRRCRLNLVFDTLQFEGGTRASILSTLDNFVGRQFEREIRDILCEQVETFSKNNFTIALENLIDEMRPFLEMENQRTVQTEFPKESSIQQGMTLVDFSDTNNWFGSLFALGTNLIDNLFGKIPSPEKGPGINEFLRDNYLDSEGTWTYDLSNFQTLIQQLQLEPEQLNSTVDTSVEFKTIRIVGLDTFTKFDVLNVKGPQTIQSEIQSDTFQIELDIVVDIKPVLSEEISPDTVELIFPPQNQIVTVKFDVEKLNADGSLLSRIDLEKISNLQIGSLLNFTNVVPCLASTSLQSILVDFFFSIGSFELPVITGLISEGLDEIIANLIQNIVSLYGDMLNTSVLENFIRESLFEAVNNQLRDIEEKFSSSSCPTYTQRDEKSQFLDFRLVLLDPINAAVAGAVGQNPLGDSFVLKSYIDNTLQISDENGFPQINEQIIAPLTLAQSNISGTLILKEKQLLNKVPLCLETCDEFDFYAHDLTVENIDSIGYPLELFNPNADNPHVIDNMLVIGHSSKPLRGSFELRVLPANPENAEEKIRAKIELKQLSIEASLLAKIEEQSFMELPFSQISNINCWIATLPSFILNEKGLAAPDDNYPIFALSDINLIVKDAITFEIECIDCNNGAVKKIPAIVKKLSEIGIFDDLISKSLKSSKSLAEILNVQFQIDQLIQNAAIQCPSHPFYETNNTLTGYAFSRQVSVSKDVIELAIYVTSILIQIGFYIVPDLFGSQQNVTDQSYDLDLDKNDYFDLTDSSSSIGILFQRGKNLLKNQLQKNSEDPTSPTRESLGINLLLRKVLLDEFGAYSVPISGISFDLNGILVSVESLNIMGLDTFNQFDAFNITSSRSMQTTFGIDALKIQLKLSITSTPTSNLYTTFRRRYLDESPKTEVKILTFEFDFEEIDLIANVIIGFNASKLEKVELGSILFTDQILPCFLPTLETFDISNIQVRVQRFAMEELSGFLSSSTKRGLLDSYNALFNDDDIIQQSINGFLDRIVRPQLRKVILQLISNETCTTVNRSMATDFVDFRDLFMDASGAKALGASGMMPYGDLASKLAFIFNQEIAVPNESGLSSINQFIPNIISIPGDIINFSQELSDIADINDVASLRLYNLTISNADSIGYPLQFLEPHEDDAYTLINQILMGFGRDPIKISFDIDQSFAGDVASMNNKVEVFAEIRKIAIQLSIFAKIDSEAILKFPIRDWNNIHCWLATISIDSGTGSNFMIRNVDFGVNFLDLKAMCTSCTSSELVEFLDSISSDGENSTLSDTVFNVMNFTQDILMSNLTQKILDQMIVDAYEKCPHKNQSSTDSEPFTLAGVETNAEEVTIGLASVILLFFAVIIVSTFFLRRSVQRKHIQWLSSLSSKDMKRLHAWHQIQENRDRALCHQTTSLFRSEYVPFFARYLVPCVVLANIGLFLSGHLNLGGAVIADLQFAGEKISIPNFFEFSVAESVQEMWTSGVKSLAIIIFALSVFWPYIRQLILLFLWTAPPSLLSIDRRGSLLNLLDSLGKWSIIDIYILMISLVCFRISVKSPRNHAILPEDFYGLDVMLLPLWGLYANMIAQLLSQLSSHFIIFYHKKVVNEASRRFKDSFPQSDSSSGCYIGKRALKDEHFNSFGLIEGKVVKLQYKSKILIGVVGLSAILLIIVGCFMPTFRIDIIGLAAQLIELGNESESATQSLSVLGIIRTVINQGTYLGSTAHFIGLISFCILFLSTTILIPLLMTFLLLSIWFLPMTSKMRKLFLGAINILSAWQFLEVYIISVFLAMWQVGDISEIMVEDLCGSFDQLFATLFILGVLSEENARCLYANVAVESGFYLLIVSSILLYWLLKITLRASKHQNEKFFTATSESSFHDEKSLDQTGGAFNSEKKVRHAHVRFVDNYSWALLFTDNKLSTISKAESIPETDQVDKDEELKGYADFDQETSLYLKSLRHEMSHDNIEVAVAMEPIEGPHFNVSIIPSQK